MTDLSTLTTTLIAGISLGIWVYLLFARGWFWRMSTAAPVLLRDGAVPSVTAVVPARNEAGVVGRAMESLAAQAYAGEFRIVLVDDGSEDGTARVARAAAPGVDVVKAGPLPADWGGKMWAVAQGVATTRGEYLLLTDADNTNVSSRVQAVVDWFGPTDVTLMGQQASPHSTIQHDGPDSPEARLLGGPVQEKRDLARTANPLTYIDKNDPPFLIMHGDNDHLVPLGQSTILAKALIDAGVEVTMKTLPGAGHEDPKFRTPENQRLIEEFLSRNLKANK